MIGRFLLLAVAAVGLVSSLGLEIVAMTPMAEAEKIGEEWVKGHPKDGRGHFFLGQLRMLGWGGAEQIILDARGTATAPPQLSHFPTIASQPGTVVPALNDVRGSRLAAAIKSYRQAIILDRGKLRYSLELGRAMEEAGRAAAAGVLPKDFPWAEGLEEWRPLDAGEKARVTGAVKGLGDESFEAREKSFGALMAMMPRARETLLAVKSDDPEIKARIDAVFRGYWQVRALSPYREAYRQALPGDLKAETFDASGDGTISLRAGERVLSMLQAHPEATEAGEVLRIEAALKQIRAKRAVQGGVIFIPVNR